ncbi:hypothetical protein [uncultured Aquimarina sp.]|uniref:hypothetical protein n=1 Tax=uncultured Aquimarina sp. TaxID=575652 RepID=UPI0026310AE0|nr:hypothetical protein [uncultured Aquimarina sp.]
MKTPSLLNECWSMDFMNHILANSRKLQVFNAVDDCNLEVLTIDIGLSLPKRTVMETLKNLKKEIGLPKFIRCDNSLESISKAFIN